MKKTFLRVKEYWLNSVRSKQYWLNLMHSTRNKMSQGAANIAKVITSAHGDQWRKKDGKK